MIAVSNTSVARASFLLLAALLAFFGGPGEVAGQIKSNLSSSVTSEAMTAVWVARERGLFKKHGLDMQFILMPRNPLAVAALIAGEIDAAIIGPGHLVNAGLSGADLIGIANFHQKLDFRLNARPDIKKPEDLRGKRIAISGPRLDFPSGFIDVAAGAGHRSGARADHFLDDSRHRDESAPGA